MMTPDEKLRYFFESPDELAIYCETGTQAKRLIADFSKMGRRWVSGREYIPEEAWINCCYSNKGTWCPKQWYFDNEVRVIEWEDIYENDQYDITLSCPHHCTLPKTEGTNLMHSFEMFLQGGA